MNERRKKGGKVWFGFIERVVWKIVTCDMQS